MPPEPVLLAVWILTDEFCGTGCQEGYGGCGPSPTPSCVGGNSAMARRIGYYESWATTRPCDVVAPEDLDLTGLAHINFAFSFFDPSTIQISPMDANAASLYSRFTALKTKRQGLKTWLSIGGWSFNDATNTPNTQHAFSDMTYGFDGVDLDWEYPAADNRGGVKGDFGNFPAFLAELRASFGSGLGISATLPLSYWYLQHFDLLGMQPSVDWFNVMSYDIHGRPVAAVAPGVDPSKVVLGLGWYGRSFTLADPACNVPNGVCHFTTGGAPGQCTRSSGTLSNAEIKRVLASRAGVEAYDAAAGVRWLTWNTNQWVSYDDGVTIQQKLTLANRRCLGGIMIWALDQDDKAGSSMNDLLGIGTANGVSGAAAESYKQQLANATLQQAVASSCYWSLCGGSCTTGYFGVTEARGQVAGIQRNSVCAPGEFQTLCCAPGTSMGTCKWEGFRGVGFPCSPACSNPSAVIVARNTNSYSMNEAGQTTDLTCTGGFQAYCCVGFVPSSITNSGNLALYGRDGNGIIKRNGGWDEVCDNQRWAISKMLNGQTVFHPLNTGRGVGRAYSSWATTNQQESQRNAAYRTLVQGARSPGGDAQCELDEFPMGNLRESNGPNPQACRLVNRRANTAQGLDYKAWKWAQWRPCSRYRETTCSITDGGPPATWKFGPLNRNRGDGSGRHFINAFGFDSQTPNSLCFASYTYTEAPGTIRNTMITDHGFRVLDDDPMYGGIYRWPRQSWRIDPAPISAVRPWNQQPAVFQKRGATISGNSTGNATDPSMTCHVDLKAQDDAELDYDELLFLDMDGNPVDGRTCDVIYEEDEEETASRLRIVVDEDGNMVDVYMTDDGDGGLWPSGEDTPSASSATATAEPVTITATTMGAARPASGETTPALPASTAVTTTRLGSVVTLPPY
ncbi:hypothetical protein C8A01DRAFT_40430 [Parachaetomium inaequale]|uniref:chitinase n=1 Tax=Parachaetomium inaequale TaxID=2588326 RepID=A0AAN6P7C9_9PEZI|nr:hypothetical protein C8A01DRAFT_40430 [Parachaetomium inaequale]